MTILELARESGINIPTLCYDPNLTSIGACRICLVENEQTGALVASCVIPIAPGMIINTHSPRVIEHRKNIVKLLLASHPDLILPSVPSGYTLLPQAESEGYSLTFTWQDPGGHQVIYQRSAASSQGETPSSPGNQSTNNISSGSGIMSINGESFPILTYYWEAEGYIHELTITDIAMSEADQQAMLP